MTPYEYVKSLPIDATVQIWAMKRKTEEKYSDERLLEFLFEMADKAIVSLHWAVFIEDYSDDGGRESDIYSASIYDYLRGKGKPIDYDNGYEFEPTKLYPYFRRLATKEELIEAQRQGLSDEERQLLIQAKNIIDEMGRSYSHSSVELKNIIEKIATSGVRTDFERQDILKEH